MIKELVLMAVFITVSFSIISICIYIAIERLKDPNYYKNDYKDDGGKTQWTNLKN